MKKLYSLTNFSAGINENQDRAADDIKNFNIRTDGALVTRAGIDFGGNGGNTFSYSVNAGLSIDLSSIQQILFIRGRKYAQTTTGLWYDNNGSFVLVDNKTTIADASLFHTDYFTNRYHVVVANQDRAFLANGKWQFWIDLSGSYPVLYRWGMDAPPFAATNIEVNTTDTQSGGTIEAGFYAYAICFQNAFGGLSPLSDRVVVEQEKDGEDGNQNRAIITLLNTTTNTIPTDTQIKYINLYRTDKQAPIPTDASEIEGTLAQNAPLKMIRQHDISVPIGNPSGYTTLVHQDTDATRSYGASMLASTEFASKPPSSLNNIVLYAGRIWGSMSEGSSHLAETTSARSSLPLDGDMLCFSAIDETAAPLYDVWPLVKSADLGSWLTDGAESPAIPHQIKTRDVVRAIGASRNYISVFGDASIQLGKGQGIIEGLYNVKLPNTDLDFSEFLDSIGSKEFCVSEMNGNLYFLSPNDTRIYRMDRDGQVAWVSLPVQEALNTYTSANIRQIVADDGLVYVLANDATTKQSDILVYEEFRNIWTRFDAGQRNISSLAVNTMENTFVTRVNSTFATPSSVVYMSGSPGLYGVGTHGSSGSSLNAFYRLFDSGAADDEDALINSSYTSQEFVFPEPTRIDTVRVGIEGTSANVTLRIDVDGIADAVRVPSLLTTDPLTGTPYTYTLSKSNNYSIRPFARGNRFKVKFELSGVQTVRFLEIQFRSR